MGLIYHVAYERDWDAALAAGKYEQSTRGRTLQEQGFIHGGQLSQVEPVANSFYAGEKGLVVLVIDEVKVTSDVRYDEVPGWDVPFPHIYGPLNVDAVVDTVPLRPDSSGQFSFSYPPQQS